MQEGGVVIERLLGIVVDAETVVFLIIIFEVCFSRPLGGTFDTEVVFGIDSQFAGAGSRLKECLRHGDRSRNTVVLLISHYNITPLGDILQIQWILLLPLRAQGKNQ